MNVALILAILQAAAQLLPYLTELEPIVQKLVAGETLTSQDNLAVWQAIVAMEQAVAAKVAADQAPASSDQHPAA